MHTAFVTGANRGLGKGFIDYLLAEGYTVFGGVRNITADLPTHERLHWITCDVCDDASIARAVVEVSQLTTALTLLVNNAGLNKDSAIIGGKEKVSKLTQLDRSALQTIFDTNSISPIMVTKHFLPLLSATDSFVINISSDRASFTNGGTKTSANYGYTASKVALNMITQSSIFDLPKNVRTCAVHPGYVKTDMNPRGPQTPLAQAERIVALTKNWQSDWNGKYLSYDGSYFPL